MKSRVMIRTACIISLLAVCVVSLGKPAAASSVIALVASPSTSNSYFYDFEETLEPWSAQSDSGITCSLMRPAGGSCGGSFYAQLQSTYKPGNDAFSPSIPDPIATWIMTGLPAPYGRVTVSIDWSTKQTTNCQGCLPAVYVGTAPPARGGQLQTVAPQLSTEWEAHHYKTSVQVGGTGMVFVAVGWMGSDASIGLDCINVTIGY